MESTTWTCKRLLSLESLHLALLKPRLSRGDINFYVVSSIPAWYCPALNDPENGRLNSTEVHYQAVVLVECNLGFVFPDGNVTTALRCIDPLGTLFNRTLSWNATFMNCQGKLSHESNKFCCFKCMHVAGLNR